MGACRSASLGRTLSCAECLCVECAGDDDSLTLQCHVSHKGQGGALLIGETTCVLGKFLWVQIPEHVLSNKILLAVLFHFPGLGLALLT